MFVVLVVPELFQNLLHFFVRDRRHVDALLLDLRHDVVQYVLRYLRALLRLELRQNLPKVVDPLVSIKANLLRWFLVRRFFVLGKILELFAARRVVAQQDPFVLDRHQLPLVAPAAHRRLVDMVRPFQKQGVGVALVSVHVGRDLVFARRFLQFKKRVQYRNVVVDPFRYSFFFVEISVNMFAVA